MAKLILLSGPSCVGKGPLLFALGKFYPHLIATWKKVVLYNCRDPRPGEKDGKDYYFRSRETIEGFRRQSRYLVADVRGDLQAVDLEQLLDDIKDNTMFFEGNPFVVEKLLKAIDVDGNEILSIFISPLSREEIECLQAQENRVELQNFVTDVMQRKLLRRTLKQKTILSQKDLADIERRASSALNEMSCAHLFDFVVVNHDGEDSEHWDAFYFPIGDARKTLECVAKLLQGQACPTVEHWKPLLEQRS